MIKIIPLGLMPHWLWTEKMLDDRINEIGLAVRRYQDVGMEIPPEWIREAIEINILQLNRGMGMFKGMGRQK